tara:strand:+ start:3955 stop:4590 length:636 start_codon:yes stop_codon:yes gene_type:complete
MDVEKSIYMRDFTTSRMSLGSITYEPVYSPLSQNIYGDLKPKKIVKQVEEVIDEIEEKTILILKNSDPLKPDTTTQKPKEKKPKAEMPKEKKPKAEKEKAEEEKKPKAEKEKAEEEKKPKEKKPKAEEEKAEKPKEKKPKAEEEKEKEKEKEKAEKPKEVVLFEDANETEGTEGTEDTEDTTKDTLEDDPIMEGGSMVKTITFNPNYVVGE